MILVSSIRRRARAFALIALVASASALASGCAGNYALTRQSSISQGGATTVALYERVPSGVPLSWFEPSLASDRASLDRWRRAVGPPVFVARGGPESCRSISELTVVSWNTAVGDADVVGFVRELRLTLPSRAPVVLLLQEVYRRGADVPRTLAARSSFASRLGGAESGERTRQDIEDVADAMGMSLYYVPSMRNGSPLDSDEDRGNAILSDLPLNDLSAIELPFEQQRRVAVGASISGLSTRGTPWTLQVVSAHLDNMVGGRRLWVAGSEYARIRQARALVHHLAGSSPTLLAGDFNTWFGFADGAYTEIARAFPGLRPVDRRGTFHGLLRLDHVFFRLPTGWRAEYRRGDARFGSDHFPLIGTVQIR